jgi:hypothetical protein
LSARMRVVAALFLPGDWRGWFLLGRRRSRGEEGGAGRGRGRWCCVGGRRRRVASAPAKWGVAESDGQRALWGLVLTAWRVGRRPAGISRHVCLWMIRRAGPRPRGCGDGPSVRGCLLVAVVVAFCFVLFCGVDLGFRSVPASEGCFRGPIEVPPQHAVRFCRGGRLWTPSSDSAYTYVEFFAHFLLTELLRAKPIAAFRDMTFT